MKLEIDQMLQALSGSCLKKQGLLSLHDLSNEEVVSLLDLSDQLKRKKRDRIRGNLLEGRNIALVFEKMSTRTRAASAVAVADEGGSTEFMPTGEIHLGKKESVKDTARVLGCMFDGIMYRGHEHRTVELLAEHSGVPVWNALTDDSHPTQALADLMTLREEFGAFKGVKLVYVGDGRNNVANSLMAGCVKVGVDFVNCTPPQLSPRADLVAHAEDLASHTGGSVTIMHDPVKALKGANAIYTDVWVSMGEESHREERMELLWPYQVNMEMMRRTGNLEKKKVIFLHCLPAFHDKNTDLTRDVGAMEVTDEVFEAPFSRVFEQAENRMHTIKAMIVASLRQI